MPWYVERRIVGASLLYTRTTELSVWGRAFVPAVLLQALLTLGLSLSLVVLAADCRVSILLALLTLAVLAAAYFAVEAVRTENAYQLLAYALASAAGMVGLVLACTEGDGVGKRISDVFLGGSEAGELLRSELIGATALQLVCFVLAGLTCRGTGELRGFGMRTYKKVGTDPQLIRRYRRYQQCSNPNSSPSPNPNLNPDPGPNPNPNPNPKPKPEPTKVPAVLQLPQARPALPGGR